MYKIELPQVATTSLDKFEQRLYRASMLSIYGYRVVTKKKYHWIVKTPGGKKYNVKYKDGEMTCDCPDAIFRAKKYADGWCKHKLFVLTQIELDDVIAMQFLMYPWLSKYLKKV